MPKRSRMGVRRKNNVALRETLQIVAVYFFTASCWILLSDQLVGRLFRESAMGFVSASIVKGMLFVTVTAALLFALVRRSIKRVLEKENEIARKNKDLDSSHALVRSIINSTPDRIFYKDMSGVYLGCNQAFADFCGKSIEQIIGKNDAQLFEEERASWFRSTDKKVMQSGAPYVTEEDSVSASGEKAWLETVKSLYCDAQGAPVGIIGISRDVTERRMREERIEYLSYHDPLTGVYNRTFLQKALESLSAPSSVPLSLIIGDVNGMKLINDAFGHRAGDKLLIDVADILLRGVRAGDTVTRIGGDEFLILLPNTDAKAAGEVAERVRMMCEQSCAPGDLVQNHLALGYATRESADQSLEETMAVAEDMMYRRKLFETQSMRNSVLTSIKTTMFEKSNETEEHAERLAELAVRFGRAAGLPKEKMDELALVATLHDIGKISIDKNTLTKTGKMSEEDWREIKKHPEVGYRIANSCAELRHIAEYILCHHERWDGGGYPRGLRGEQIPLIARIISIVDAYDAMTQDRTYRKAMTHEQAVEEVLRNGGTQFDPALATQFVGMLEGCESK